VDSHGKIRMPLLDEDIQAACMTEDSLGEDIARRYREHELLRNPTVYVSVKEYQSQPVAVLGAVNLPGKFILKRPVRLREMLVFFAGGPNPKAGAKVQILSTVQDSMCTQEGEAPSTADAKAEPSFAVYDLQELLSGLESADPPIRRGDIINVPSAEEAYVIGNVQHPTTIPIIEPITLTRAVAIAGGFLPNSKKDKIRILRQVPGNSVGTEILVDLNSKDKNMGSDYLLRGGDIVEVSGPTGFQKVMLDMSKVFLPTLTSMPYRAIP
jgi:polysaccharide export outer membrane protein